MTNPNAPIFNTNPPDACDWEGENCNRFDNVRSVVVVDPDGVHVTLNLCRKCAADHDIVPPPITSPLDVWIAAHPYD